MRQLVCLPGPHLRRLGASAAVGLLLAAVLISSANAAVLLPPPALTEVVGAFRRGQCGSIVDALRALSEYPDLTGARSTYLLAHCHMRAGNHTAAIAAFDSAAQKHPTLGSWARLYAASLALDAGAYGDAVARTERLVAAGASPPVAGRARMLMAGALVRMGSGGAARGPLAEVLAATTDAETVAKAWWLMGLASEQAGDRSAAVRAYGMAWWAVPQNAHAADAVQRLRALQPNTAPVPPIEARLERARRLVDRGSFREAESELVRTVHSSPAGAVAGEAWYRLGLLRLGKSTAIYPLRQAARYGNAARAEFSLGRALVLAGRSAEGKITWERLVRERPQSEWAARALLALARAAEVERNWSLAERWLLTLTRRFPRTTSADEARWRRGWLRFQRGRLSEAEQIFLQAATAFPTTQRSAANLYWAGKARERMGREARGLLEGVARQYPLTYYGQRARARLRLAAPPRIAAPQLESLHDDQVYPAYAELAALGLDLDAAEEAKVLPSDSDRETRRAAALVLARTGDAHRSVRIAEPAAIPALHGGSPLDAGMWMLAYPRAYRSLVSPVAQPSGVDPLLAWAMMREESRYDPTVVSIASAVGLMQVLPSTASRIAGRSLGPEQLMDPGLNIQLGVAYLAAMLRRFDGDVVLAVAAYNAGPVAASRFARLPRTDPDVFIESIPFSETRAYVQRVLQSYGIYRWLYP